MALTDTDEFTVYNTFNTNGVVTSDTLNSWRKKTNGIINEVDRAHDLITNILPIAPDELSLGSPTWTTAGDLSTYNDGSSYSSFTAGPITVGSITATTITAGSGTISGGAFVGTSLNVGSGAITTLGTITGARLKVGGTVTTPSTGAVNSLSLAVGTNNTQFTVSAAGAIVGTSLNVGSGAITGGTIVGTSLNVGSGAITGGTIVGTSLNVGSGAITSGAISCASLNAGSGTIQTTGNAIAATPTLSTHLTPKGYVDGMFSYGTLSSVPGGSTAPFLEFTSIPSDVKRITIMLFGVSTNGTSQLAIVLGDSGGYEVTGYISSVSRNGGNTGSTTSFAITEYTAALDGYYGSIVLTRFVPDVNNWILSGSVNSINDSRVHSSSGIKGLSGSLDRIKVTTVGGVNTFDSGSVNIMYEY